MTEPYSTIKSISCAFMSFGARARLTATMDSSRDASSTRLLSGSESSAILSSRTTESTQTQYQAVLADARANLDVDLDSVQIELWATQKKSAREMFQDAQGLGPATDRLAAYTELVSTYPDSSVSVQAQFMIGFIYSEELKNHDEAEKALRELLERYPDSELAESARWMLENMRTKDAPDFVDTPADSSSAGSGSSEGSGSP